MNTVARGSAFEDTIAELLESQIDDNRFWARQECCRVFRRKGYHSKDRQSEIVFDISIEVCLPGEQSYSVLVLVECKDYEGKIPVNDVEEFWAKVQQVTGANVKGVFASTTAFQEGALRFAASKGLGVLRHFGGANFKWVLNRSASWSGSDELAEAREISAGLTMEAFASSYYDCFFYANGTYTHSSNRMFEALCLQGATSESADLIAAISNPSKQARPRVPYAEKQDIELAASECLRHIGHGTAPVDLAALCEWQQRECGLTVRRVQGVATASGTIGSLSFDPVEICLYDDSGNYARTRFTLAHELGHLLLKHDLFMQGEITRESDLQCEAYRDLHFVDLRRMEWQANFFASCVLLPLGEFVARFFQAVEIWNLRDRGYGLLYVDDQPVNQAAFMAVTSFLSNSFDVSRQAALIRLKELGYLNDARQPRRAPATTPTT